MSKTYGNSIAIDYEVKGLTDNPFIKMDLLNPDWEYIKSLKGKIKVIWASPPCTTFSVASIGKHWNKDKTPKTDKCRENINLVKNTIKIIDIIKPKYWFIENPRGMLRTLGLIGGIRHTLTYCQYGEERMKPTDIWTNNPYWKPKAPCKNGDPCHVAAPRGAKIGTQGLKNNFERSKLPLKLCKEIINSCNY